MTSSLLIGTLVELNALNGVIKCDILDFGKILVLRQSAYFLKTCKTNNEEFRCGDRVSFNVNESKRSDCRFTAYNMKRLEDTVSNTQNINRIARGRICFVCTDFGSISIEGDGVNYKNKRACFFKEDLVDGCKDLQSEFPIRTIVTCSVLPYRGQSKKFQFTAKNVKKIDESSMFPSVVSANFPPMVETQPLSVAKLITRDVGCQTENDETQDDELYRALKNILENKDIYHMMTLTCAEEARHLIDYVYKD